jgi:hypothetical protein
MRVLGGDVMSKHSTPTLAADVLGHRSTSRSVSAAHLYTMPGTGSVNTAVDLDEGLKYLSGLLGLPAPGGVQPSFPLVNAPSAAAAQPPRSPSPVLATVTNRCCRCAGLYTIR